MGTVFLQAGSRVSSLGCHDSSPRTPFSAGRQPDNYGQHYAVGVDRGEVGNVTINVSLEHLRIASWPRVSAAEASWAAAQLNRETAFI